MIGCQLHKLHLPRNKTVEFHHIIPVAWQLHTAVGDPPYPGPDLDGRGMLWDNRVEVICPTGHRNVHHWIVLLMHAVADANDDNALHAYAKVAGKRRTPVEFGVAFQALTRFVAEANVSLLALTAAGEWGEA